VKTIKLISGDAGKTKLLFKAGNNASKGQTAMPTGIAAALSSTASVTVQMRGSDAPAECFSSTLTEIVTQESNSFKAK
jgi:hypothetical protein